MNAQHAKDLTKKFWDDLILVAVVEAATTGQSACTVTRPWLTVMQIMRVRPPMFVLDDWRDNGFKVEVREEYIHIHWE